MDLELRCKKCAAEFYLDLADAGALACPACGSADLEFLAADLGAVGCG